MPSGVANAMAIAIIAIKMQSSTTYVFIRSLMSTANPSGPAVPYTLIEVKPTYTTTIKKIDRRIVTATTAAL